MSERENLTRVRDFNDKRETKKKTHKGFSSVREAATKQTDKGDRQIKETDK